MWYWEIVFKSYSRNETINIRGNNYPDKEMAQWMLGEWLRKFLPSFYLYKMESAEVRKEET